MSTPDHADIAVGLVPIVMKQSNRSERNDVIAGGGDGGPGGAA